MLTFLWVNNQFIYIFLKNSTKVKKFVKVLNKENVGLYDFFDSYQKYIPSRVNSTELLQNSGLLWSSNPNFAKFTGKHLHQSPFLNKVVFIEKETLAQVFSCEFCEICKNTFSSRTPLLAASISAIKYINK